MDILFIGNFSFKTVTGCQFWATFFLFLGFSPHICGVVLLGIHGENCASREMALRFPG
jgi:hypothetical protein